MAIFRLPRTDQRRVLAALLGASFLLAACGSTELLVTAERSDEIQNIEIPTTDPDEGPDEPPTTDPPPTTEPPAPDTTVPTPGRNDMIEPDEAMGDPGVVEIDPTTLDLDAINFGDNKSDRDYDNFLLASLADIESWLEADFETAFGIPYEPLEGEVYAGYEDRRDPIPGCGEATTSYDELQLFVAFYCPLGDFIVYDDGESGLLFALASEFGPATIGIVLAHEYGHAIQQRSGALRLNIPTVTTEQQADCIAGAWSGRAAGGQAPGVPFSDNDIRAGLIAMIRVQDPVGLDPTEPGGHGSGFDRVGAFQVGFNEGLNRCAQLIDDPLPLTPLEFTPNDFETGGNAPFGFGENDLFGFLVPDLNLLFDNDLDAEFPSFEQLTLEAVQSRDEIECDQTFGLFELGVELCSETNTAYLNEPVARSLYDEFGDFAPGYLLGIVWAEHAQITNSSTLSGEPRQLLNDCLVGAWVDTVTPDPSTGALPQPRDPDRVASISPNDLTEAIQTAIVIGDPSRNTDILGSAFEKINAFRQGALGGIGACA